MCLRLCYQVVEEILHQLLSMKLHLKNVLFSIHSLVLNSMRRVAPWFQDLNIWKGIPALMKHDSFRTPNILSLGHVPPSGKRQIMDQTGGWLLQQLGFSTSCCPCRLNSLDFSWMGSKNPSWYGREQQISFKFGHNTKTYKNNNHMKSSLPQQKINQQFSDDVVFLVIKNDTCSDFLASPRCFCFLISGVSDSTPLSRSLGIWFGSVVFFTTKITWWNGGETYP